MSAAMALQEEVKDELRWDPEIHAERIGVTVVDGVVQLDGHVDNLYEKWAAERAVMRLGGVNAVANEIQVDMSASDRQPDSAIASAIANQFDWNHAIPKGVKAAVSNGWVVLSGTVEAEFQRREAERVVRPMKGIKGMLSKIEIRPTVDTTVVKECIVDALRRNAILDADSIQVESHGGTVTLRGRVNSWAQREEVRRTAWAAPGVTWVDDTLTLC